MDDSKPVREPVKFNYRARGRYFILTDKTGCPSAEFKCRSESGVIVHDTRHSSADP
ncbi:MAG: hypothetical protein K6T65_01255 [Peptococcaceae bacterium]|nr:hypothetical protein [Peptococcaceae bacterium]